MPIDVNLDFIYVKPSITKRCISMKTEEAVKRYGSKYRLAQLLGITRQAVGQWGENLPELQALKLEKLEREMVK